MTEAEKVKTYKPEAPAHPGFDRIFKVATAAGALLTAIWGIWQYVDTAQRDAAKPFLAERLADCVAASSAAALIAAPVDASKQGEQQDTFWRLYWGPLAIVEDTDVESKMVNFGRLLRFHADELKAGTPIDGGTVSLLTQAALQVSHACRAMVSSDFR